MRSRCSGYRTPCVLIRSGAMSMSRRSSPVRFCIVLLLRETAVSSAIKRTASRAQSRHGLGGVSHPLRSRAAASGAQLPVIEGDYDPVRCIRRW